MAPETAFTGLGTLAARATAAVRGSGWGQNSPLAAIGWPWGPDTHDEGRAIESDQNFIHLKSYADMSFGNNAFAT
jgi:hypothetical protein